MRRSKVEVYLHLIWTTEGRQGWLTPGLAPPMYGCIANIAERVGCTVLAIGGMPDHMHLVVKSPSKTAVA
jgi:putative transposase